MSLNKFIHSKTVREYYDSIDYEISPIVAFWVIINSTYKFIGDMHKDLRDLMNNTEDISIDELCLNIKVIPTLHSLINHYIDLFNSAYQKFKSEEDGVVYRIYNRALFDDFDNGYLESFFSYEECIRQIHIRTSNLKNVSLKNIAKWDAEEFVIRKSLPEEYDHMILHVTKDNKILDLYEYDYSEMREFITSIESLDFDFPLPFETGDIVRLMRDKGWLNNMVFDERQHDDSGYTNPLVSCTVVTNEDDVFTYLDVNPFELEICDSRERDIYSLTRLICQLEKHNISISEFLDKYDSYKHADKYVGLLLCAGVKEVTV